MGVGLRITVSAIGESQAVATLDAPLDCAAWSICTLTHSGFRLGLVAWSSCSCTMFTLMLMLKKPQALIEL